MIEDILHKISKEIECWLNESGVTKPVVELERSANPDFGEYSSNVAMRYAKELKQNPVKLAEQLVDFLQTSSISGLEKAQWVEPGFVNLYFTQQAKTQHLDDIIKAGGSFGSNQLHQGEKWVIEHTSPNPNKAMHIGHLRNNLVGMGIVRLLQKAGADVVSDAVYNDRGIAIAKVMYGFLAHMVKDKTLPIDIGYWAKHQKKWFTPEEKELKPDIFIENCYVLAETDFNADPEVETMVRKFVVDWEAQDKITWKLWEHVLHYAYMGQERTLKLLGSHWDKVWYEHDHYQKGKDYVVTGLENGIFQKLGDGAVLTNLEEKYGLSDTVLLKKDGTSLYITQDIALTDLKKKTYEADKLVWVIGPEQSLAMKQLFAVCEQLGIGQLDDFTHVPYGKVVLKTEDGTLVKMSSRTGTVIHIEDIIDAVKAVIKARFDEENKHPDSVRDALAEKLALAAVKFSFLKSDRNQDMSFDVAQSVDVHGDSGMYVMYTYVRTQSILRKAGDVVASPVTTLTTSGAEAALLRDLLYFDDVIKKSVKDLSVHHVAQYLLELSSKFNSWYAQEMILDGSDKEDYRLKVVQAVAVTLKNGLSLLGIDTVAEM